MSWTGGQYSLLRALLGIYLAVHFAALLPWGAELWSDQGVLADADRSPLFGLFPGVFWLSDGPAFVVGVLALATLASLALALGRFDRVAAILLWWIWASLYCRNPLISNPGLPYVGLLLVAHALHPPAPYGSLAARGRVDPGGGWRMDPWLFAALWILMAVGYSYSGLTKLASPSWIDGTAMERVLANPLARPGAIQELARSLPDALLRAMSYGALAFELLFAPLALWRRARPWLWAAMLGMHLGLIVLIDFADLSLGMVLLHAATFDPRWIPPRRPEGERVLFYDGECGLCHGSVRSLLAEDVEGSLRFAPLQGPTLEQRVPAEQRRELPDSIVLHQPDGSLLMRSDAVVALLRGLGGLWGGLGAVLAFVPRRWRDAGYDALARIRKRLFAAPKGLCPMLPPSLGARFLP